ncbi:MAG: hypothetical protein ACJA2S_005262, partial [Cyclobacteriaceae bacterium]
NTFKVKEELTLKFIQGSYVCSSSDTSGLCPGVVHFLQIFVPPKGLPSSPLASLQIND